MDIEKTIAFILEHQARHEVAMAKHDEAMAQHNQAMAQHDQALARIDARLDRAIRLDVQEARRERRGRRELDEKLTQLAAAQLVTEEKVQKLSDKIDAIVEMRRNGGNGHLPA